MDYVRRTVDAELDVLVVGLPAVSLAGAKGVGKTATAERRARSVLRLDSGGTRANAEADPAMILTQPPPLLIDEWHLVPPVWDVVRRAVDDDRTPGRFLLTGSALPPADARIHSGAGRIVKLVMRPMTLPERHVSQPTVSLAALLGGGAPPVGGACPLGLADYAREIVASGLPGVRQDPDSLRQRTLMAYVDELLERDIPELGTRVRRPAALRAWLTAYAAASATTTSYTRILDAATPGEADKPAATTATAYRALLERTWVLDPVPAWIPVFNPLKRLARAPKHHLVDPAIAAVLLGASIQSLLRADHETGNLREGTLLGALFESLAALTLRVFAQPLGARVSHLRTRNGDHKIDFIVERPDHRILAVEAKLTSAPTPADALHLTWLGNAVGDQLIDRVLLTTSPRAYRTRDGVAVVPLGLLGP
ncbi:MAG: DUF4143 domain-containing protein [Actinomycetia bacterium]|nr:DUF4143 domain-containing protein [Actinomycetes bacterium]